MSKYSPWFARHLLGVLQDVIAKNTPPSVLHLRLSAQGWLLEGHRGSIQCLAQVVLLGWLFECAAERTSGDVTLGEDQQDDCRYRGENGGCHHRSPALDLRAEVAVNSERHRLD